MGGLLALFFCSLNGAVLATEFPVDVKVKSVAPVRAKIYSKIYHSYLDSGMYAEGLLVTLDEPIECSLTENYKTNYSHVYPNIDVISNNVIYLPSSNLQQMYFPDRKDEIEHAVEISRTDKESLDIIQTAIRNIWPVTFFDITPAQLKIYGNNGLLGLSGDSREDGSTTAKYWCVFNGKNIALTVPEDADQTSSGSSSQGGTVEEGTTVPNPIQTNWGFDVETEGDYQILVHWVVAGQPSSEISIGLDNEAEPSVVNVKPNFGSGVWLDLGEVRHLTAGTHEIQLGIDETGPYIVDGVKVKLVQ